MARALGRVTFPHLGLAQPVPTHYRLKKRVRGTCFRAAALPVAVRSGLVDQFGNVPLMPMAMERRRNPWCSPPNTLHDLPAGARL